jgi:hypothetical protein
MKFSGIRKNLFVLYFIVSGMIVFGYDARADFVFGPPTNPGQFVNTAVSDGTPCISPDGLSLYLTSNRPGSNSDDLWVVTRSSKEESWSAPSNLGPGVNSSSMEYFPSIGADGLSIYFLSNREDGFGSGDLWVATRSSIYDDWNTAVNMGANINSSRGEASPYISHDGLTLLFASNRPGGYGNYDIYISTRDSTDSAWSEAVNLGPSINGPHLDVAPCLSPDGSILFFHSIRPSGYGTYDLYYSRWNSLDSEWSEPVNIGPPVNSSYSELGPSISGDGRHLYFSGHFANPPRPGGLGNADIWQVSIDPIIDLNSDGIVDAADMCFILDNWGKDYPLCDIGPMPWGDGIVDVEDLKVLAEHLFEEILPYGCVAYWKLDQTEGNIAHNSAGENDGICYGEPFWQPANGHIDGALKFDGIDDYITTDFILDPADGVFSVFAWIKGGVPGQVIISQTDGTGTGQIWLGIEPSEGKLMTGLSSIVGRSSSTPLVSDFVITDGLWHHVGIVVTAYQSMRLRNLYIDGVIVVPEYIPVKLPTSDGGLHIGVDKNLDEGSFFSGLIDDVRIYDVALTPEQIEAMVK